MEIRRITITEAKDLVKQGYLVKIIDGIAYTDAPIGITPAKEIDILDVLKKARDAVQTINGRLDDHDTKLSQGQTAIGTVNTRLDGHDGK